MKNPFKLIKTIGILIIIFSLTQAHAQRSRLSIYPTRRADKIKISDTSQYFDGRKTVEEALAAIATGDVTTADEVGVDVTNFNTNLDSGDTTVQIALDSIDDLALGGAGSSEWTDEGSKLRPNETADAVEMLGIGSIGAAIDKDYTFSTGSIKATQLVAGNVTIDLTTTTQDVADTEYIEYSTGGAVIVRDDVLINLNRRYVGYEDIDFLIFAPDGVDDEIYIFHVDADKYPNGIKLENVQITLNADAAYSMVFEEWSGDPPTATNDIETVTTGVGDAYKEVVGADIDDSNIAADAYIYLHVPATDIDWVGGKVIFYAK